MSRVEDKVNGYIVKHSELFLTRLKQYAEGRIASSTTRAQRDIFKKLAEIDQTIQLGGNVPVQGPRSSRLDLYYKSPKTATAFVVELKVEPVGFRGIAQAAYYNACLRHDHDFVILLAPDKGPDFDEFIAKCIKRSAWSRVLFIKTIDIGLRLSHGTKHASFTNK